MPRQKRTDEESQGIPGQKDDGTFDLSDVPIDPTELPGACPEDAAGEPTDVDELVTQLQAELDEAIEARKRALADFVNYRRRAEGNEVRARQDGAFSVLRSLLPLLDNVERALDQDIEEVTTEQLVDGVRIMQDELLQMLERHQVRQINPEPGSEFDPNEHQAVMCECGENQPPNSIVSVMQIGYATPEAVLRPASVSVAAPEQDGDAEA